MMTEQSVPNEPRRSYAPPELMLHGSLEKLTTTPNFASVKSALPTAAESNRDQGVDTKVA